MPINADLKIGTISETIAVAAASPVVDVQNTGRVQVMNREMIDNIPNARNCAARRIDPVFDPGYRGS